MWYPGFWIGSESAIGVPARPIQAWAARLGADNARGWRLGVAEGLCLGGLAQVTDLEVARCGGWRTLMALSQAS